jgi:hypothetical protein
VSDEAIHNYRCYRCGNTECVVGEIYAAGGFWSKVFDVEGRHLSTVTCSRCKLTEFYQAKKSQLSNLFDFFTT